MQRLGLRFNIYFALSNKNSVLRSFPPAKIPLSAAELGGSVYQLTCLCPDGSSALYIGQSSVPIRNRMAWHESDWTKDRGSFSGHKVGDGHNVQFNAVQIIEAEENYEVRVLKEAFHILRLTLNGDNIIANPNLENRDGRRINKSDGLRRPTVFDGSRFGGQSPNVYDLHTIRRRACAICVSYVFALKTGPW